MGAVRSSNTRASHASVDMSNGNAEARGLHGAAGGSKDSPHFADDPDRRASFSYLRRASERRRRLRMREQRESELAEGRGDDEQLDLESRRDSRNSNDKVAGQQYRLRRSQRTYDEEGEHEDDEAAARMLEDEDGLPDGAPLGQDDGYDQRQQHQYGGAAQGRGTPGREDHRRQSINDQLTDVVSNVIEFVREESFRRGKRHSFHRRRQAAAGGYSASSAHSGAGSLGGTEGEMDSDGVRYRKRRMMRRSPRRSAAAQQRQMYLNDSDTGSMASIDRHQQQQHHLHQQQQQQASHQGAAGQPVVDMRQQRYRLQQHGGSVQDGGAFYGGPEWAGERHHAELMDQHRRYQSADACEIDEPRLHYGEQHHGAGYASDAMGHHHHEGRASADGNLASASVSSIIRPLQVGQSPPPPFKRSAEAELVAARRRREQEDASGFIEDEDETAIHIGPDDEPEGGADRAKGHPGRFVAPKVAPLNSPSALIMPDEEIIPPNVPYRGRRLPQIPGSGVIKTAADFLHSSLYGRHQHQMAGAPGSVVGMAAAANTVAASPLVLAGHAYPTSAAAFLPPDVPEGEPVFPSVSESPTIKIEAPVPPQAGLIKRHPTIDQQVASSMAGGGGAPLPSGSSLDGSSSINFPRVSFSPTHVEGPAQVTAAPSSAAQTMPKYHGASAHGPTGPIGPSAASLIATQSTSGATQSAVLAPAGGGAGEPVMPDRLGWARNRRLKKEDEDDWF